jgi:uroporphyrinogen decarboxylase
MGLPFSLQPNRGPVPARPIRTRADVERLAATPDATTFGHVLDLLRTVRQALANALPVLVFAGAPFTVATYCVDVGKDILAARRFAAEHPVVWDALLDRIGQATVHFLNALIAEGAAAYQLFDSWAGELDRADYLRWAQPYHQSILAGARGVPRILFVKEGPYLDLMCQSGAEVVSLGVRHDLAAAQRDYPHLVFQGNVNEEILRDGTPEQVRTVTQQCLTAGAGYRHIVNLNHGVDRATPVANFEAYVQTARTGA